MNAEGAQPERYFWIGLGGLAPVVVAMGLVALRDSMRNANVALVLVAVVVLVAAAGGREAGAAAAVASALSFDFFHTQPYLRLRIASSDDVESTLLLLVVALMVGHVASRGRQASFSAQERSGEVRRIYRVAELVAKGDEPADIIMATQAELIELLHLQECRFEAFPYSQPLERVERSGVVTGKHRHFRNGGFELPSVGVELPVLGRGHVLGRFVLVPTAGTGVSLEQRVVAVALSDQVGAVLSGTTSGEEHRNG